ncbi:hypothetical protein FXW07_12170 [Methanosarcina sp. DH1]|uniref:hypothetical protein n=1 Tax=Methanosarcina sp. DH1 TaxID=2605695 RepID=UPI001E59F434|nr:hypothetical protein [Methanosarcina sp. DH1]MCC4767354.1 hypothetical protein [Methanosarcina sp. DH1]
MVKKRYGKNNHALLEYKNYEKCFSETRGTVFFQLNTPEKEILKTISLIPEKGGIRGLARATGHSNTRLLLFHHEGKRSKEKDKKLCS